MRVEEKLPEDLQDALRKGLLKRLPLTFLPFVNQQLHEWEYLFPSERQSTERLLLYVASLDPEQSSGLFWDVVQLEEKMGVRHWQFSTTEQTIQNSSLLARSPYFQDWRRAVQAVFDAADQHAVKTKGAPVKSANRLVLLDIPLPLPVDAASVWRRWQGIGRPLELDLTRAGGLNSPLEFLLAGTPTAAGGRSGGLLDAARSRSEASSADTWVIEAGNSLVDHLVDGGLSAAAIPTAILLSNARLDRYRQSFSHEMNTMSKDLADADAVFDHLRKVDVTPWCPPEVASEPAVREFLRALYLTGNGAVIYGNSFVEWAASEAFRRARPSFLAAQFGIRSKPKPFTGVAVFDNPDQVNPLPAVDDLPGSAVDAQMLALYVWLAAHRYEEYQRSTVCVCLAESLGQAYVVAPPEFALWRETQPVPLDHLAAALRAWIA
ncbi:MAG: hypothetical protein ABSF71_12825 [Terriglobia bacterium]|jgi:hypothetical protein